MKSNIRLNQKDKLFFVENLGTLLNSGVPIIKALQIILFQAKNTNLKKLSEFLIISIESGESFFQISAKLPKIFNVFDVAILEMWDATGQIGKSFEIIVEKEERESELTKKIKQALIYPIAIILVAVIMIIIIMTYVIPKIEWIYKEANVNLPQLTQILIWISHFLCDNLFLIILVIGVFFIGCLVALKDRRVRKWFDTHILDIFIFGNIIQKRILITFCEFLSTLLSAGVLINKSLLIVKNGIGNIYYEDEITLIIEEIKSGKTLSTSLGSDILEKQWNNMDTWDNKIATDLSIHHSNFFPIELSTAVKIGEQTGTLGKMLERVSSRYNKEVDNIIKNISAMLEPIIIVVLWIIVGTIVLAIMLPFFNMVNVIK